ncbi:prephenate dehydrogenase [Halarsenatibacter silvermanii]|uniref:Prephenate dehydrogenase n=1 Tax=Halarsenatibacter silvermanii TaxID=321763 RepID=A0A1G9P4J1_9FIRM|nr:prephenate dehydrogenase/arogenate dehydrogenase family protein [Halarsenatibacter silvermanii]SDL93738.1 prephenate dehydrogenase [Halarsenatibacter silvermanii]
MSEDKKFPSNKKCCSGQIYSSIAVVGLGLIGASLGAAVSKNNLAAEVRGYDIDRETVEMAEDGYYFDSAHLLPDSCYTGIGSAELVIISVPVIDIPVVMEDISEKIGPKTTIIDTGSCKGFVMEKAAEIFTDQARFIGGHPLAGSEKSGIKNLDPELFIGSDFVLTPREQEIRSDKLEKLLKLIGGLDARVKIMDCEKHDRYLALVSHLPQIASSGLAGFIGDEENLIELLELASSGFSDTTRLAASNSNMWTDITLANKDRILEAMEDYLKQIETLVDAIQSENREEVKRFFEKGIDVRKRFEELKGE